MKNPECSTSQLLQLNQEGSAHEDDAKGMFSYGRIVGGSITDDSLQASCSGKGIDLRRGASFARSMFSFQVMLTGGEKTHVKPDGQHA